MRISHRHRFVFLSNPQSGSTSIREALDPYSDIKSSPKTIFPHHSNAKTLKAHFETQGWNWEDYFKFITVRNPWDKMVARYYYGLSTPTSVWHQPALEAGSFVNFLDHPVIVKRALNSSLQVLAYSTDGKCLVDEILKLEELRVKWPSVTRRLGLEEVELPHTNKKSRSRPHYSTFFDEDARNRVAEWFRFDIMVTGYRFESME